jgi:hypothetical protein
MVIKGASPILLPTLVVAMMLSITGCAKRVEETDVVGTYVKANEQPVKFYTSATEITLDGTSGEVMLRLKAGGEAVLGDQTLPWRLDEGKVVIYFFNASTSGDFKRDKIVDLGGEGMIWNKQ